MSADPHCVKRVGQAAVHARRPADDFEQRRRVLLERLRDPRRRAEAARELEDVWLAQRLGALSEDEQSSVADDPTTRLRRLIAASLEGGLLRPSRRARILSAARRLGISEFHAHLLIAQVQVGLHEDPMRGLASEPASLVGGDDAGFRVGLRLMAAGVLGVAMFLAMVRYLAL